MLGELREECAVAGAYLKRPIADMTGGAVAAVYTLLAAQTNRGDLSCGIARYHSGSHRLLDVMRGKGIPEELFGKPGSHKLHGFLAGYESPAAIGHNRYATSGDNENPTEVECAAQPFLRRNDKSWKEFAFCYNGNLPNAPELRTALRGESGELRFRTDTDTELIEIYLSLYLSPYDQSLTDKDHVGMFADLAARFDGAYNICFLDARGTMVVGRDPNGFRPLSWAETDEMFACASESSALRHLGLDSIRFLAPGELLIVDEHGLRLERFAEQRPITRCAFETIYFMKSGSAFDGISVQLARERIGYELAQIEPLPLGDDTVIAPIPNTAVDIRSGYVNALIARNVRFRLADVLIQEGHDRTFIADFGTQDRLSRIRKKFDMTPGYLDGRDVVLIDDSIVRGHTSRCLVRYVREYGGARSVHLRVGAPPYRFPCFYGINMPTRTELIAANRDVEELRQELEVDTLVYLPEEALVRALGEPLQTRQLPVELCLGCFSGHYPTPWANRCLERILARERSRPEKNRPGKRETQDFRRRGKRTAQPPKH